MTRVFDEDALLRASTLQVPEGDFGDDDFRPALAALLRALEHEAQLDPRGQWAATARIIAALNRRRRLSDLLSREPAVTEVELQTPIFILGFPRTGTTMLHNLLAGDRANRAIRLWEMREPFAPRNPPPTWKREVIETTSQLVEAGYQLSPRLRQIHPLRATWPDECSWLFRNSFASMVFGFSYFIPSYLEFLAQRDASADYEYFRLQLQAILFQRPGTQLVLKDPCHIWNLDALLKAFPDARVIHLHRRLEQVVPSFCSLCQALQEGGATARPLPEIGAYATDMLTHGMQRMLEVRAELEPGRIYDLDYRRLVDDPLATVGDIYAHFGLELDEGASSAMHSWLEQSRGLTGKHSYSLDMFGLDASALAQRFAPYDDTIMTQLEGRAR